MVSRTLVRYFGMRFLGAVMSVFFGIFVLVVLVDYIEFMRRAADVPNVSAWMVAKASFFRVPQLTERLLPFSVLVGAMTCYLALSRRNELVVARSAGMSAWQFVAPALIVRVRARARSRPRSTIRCRPRCANGRSGSRRRSSATARPECSRARVRLLGAAAQRRRPVDRLRGLEPGTGRAARRRERVHLRSRRTRRWSASRPSARRSSPATGGSSRRVVYVSGAPPRDHETYLVKTNLTAAQVRESFSTPETVPFWDLPAYIEIAERSGLVAAGYKLQYQILIARPFLLCCHGSSCLFCQFKILPLRRRRQNGFEWHRGGLSALCLVQGD